VGGAVRAPVAAISWGLRARLSRSHIEYIGLFLSFVNPSRRGNRLDIGR
jgi:hypothetical protein